MNNKQPTSFRDVFRSFDPGAADAAAASQPRADLFEDGAQPPFQEDSAPACFGESGSQPLFDGQSQFY
eukprot:1383144-Pyramimonas_sp.AAC.1